MNPLPTPVHVLSAEEFRRFECSPVRQLVHMILILALKDRASDVYFEPQESEYRLSYRVAGVLYEMVPPPQHLGNAISQVFIVLGELDFCDPRSSQVGRMMLEVGTGAAEVGILIDPTPQGAAIHLTISDNTTTIDEINQVFSEWDKHRAARRPYDPLWPWLRWVLNLLGVKRNFPFGKI